MQKQQPQAWIPWAFAEAFARATTVTVMKATGLAFGSVGEGILSTFVIGLVQMVGALAITTARGYQLWIGKRFFFWCWVFSVNATILTVIPIVAFGAGADMAKYLFLANGLSIVPGVLIDIAFFNMRFGIRGWCGILIAIFGGYAMFEFPSGSELFTLPLWVYAGVLAMVLVAANQGVARKLTDVRTDVPHLDKAVAQNVFVGAMTAVLCICAFIIVGTRTDLAALAALRFVASSAIIGTFIICLVGANLMAYQRGAANIPIKKIVATGAFLFASGLSGHIFFGEPLGWEKFLGIGLYVAAFFLIDSERKR